MKGQKNFSDDTEKKNMRKMTVVKRYRYKNTQSEGNDNHVDGVKKQHEWKRRVAIDGDRRRGGGRQQRC